MIGIPTDCPQRDERLGWMGDIQVFARHEHLQRRHGARSSPSGCADVRDAQTPTTAASPTSRRSRSETLAEETSDFMGVPGWGDAGVVVPWRLWQNYGDRRHARPDTSTRPSDGSSSSARNNPDLLWKNKRGNDYGDWLNGDTMNDSSDARERAARCRRRSSPR